MSLFLYSPFANKMFAFKLQTIFLSFSLFWCNKILFIYIYIYILSKYLYIKLIVYITIIKINK
jgi:hypothetical protein